MNVCDLLFTFGGGIFLFGLIGTFSFGGMICT